MKKIIAITLCIIMIFSLSACDNNKKPCSDCGKDISTNASFCEYCGASINTTVENEESSNDSFTNNIESSKPTENIPTNIIEPFELNNVSYEIKLEELKNIVDYNFSQKLFITKDGSLYKIGKFSDGTNAKKISEGLNLLKFRRGTTIVSENNFLYLYNYNDYSLSHPFSEKDYLNHSFVTFPNGREYKATLKNNEIHLVYYRDGDLPPEYNLHRFESDETIELFINGTIKTNKGYYYYKETREHSEYDDVPDAVTFSLEKMTVLDDNIIFIKYYDRDFCTVDKNGHLKIYYNVKTTN